MGVKTTTSTVVSRTADPQAPAREPGSLLAFLTQRPATLSEVLAWEDAAAAITFPTAA